MPVQQKILGMLIQPINPRFRRDQLQQRTLVGIIIFCIDFINIGRVKSINTGELFPPACKVQIRESGKLRNIINEENLNHETFFS